MTTLPTEHVNVGDLSMAFHQCGSGEPLVLLHGFTGGKLDFQNQMSWFADRYHVIAPDQRGHGETSHALPYAFGQLVTDLLGFLDTLAIGPVHLLGHSLGGMIAMRAVLTAPENFRSLILMDTSSRPVSLIPPELRVELAEKARDKGTGILARGMRTLARTASQQRGIDFLGEDEHWRRIEWKLEHMDWRAFRDLGSELWTHEAVTSRLAEIRIPTTVIVGADDTRFIEPSAEMHAVIPESHLTTIANAGHSPQYENASAWKIAVQDHLNRARP